MAFSPNGMLLASGDSTGTIILWDAAMNTNRGRLTGHPNWVADLAFDPAGKILASGGCNRLENQRCTQGVIILWDIVSQEMVYQPLIGHNDGVNSLAFSSDGQMLASASGDNTIILWDVATFQQRLLKGHRDAVNSLSFSPDGRLLASGSHDGTIILWDLATGKPLGQPLEGHQSRPVGTIAFHPVQSLLASGGDDGNIILWNVDFDAWQKRACRLANRELTDAELTEFVGPGSAPTSFCTALPLSAEGPLMLGFAAR